MIVHAFGMLSVISVFAACKLLTVNATTDARSAGCRNPGASESLLNPVILILDKNREPYARETSEFSMETQTSFFSDITSLSRPKLRTLKSTSPRPFSFVAEPATIDVSFVIDSA